MRFVAIRHALSNPWGALRDLGRFLGYFGHRFVEDRCLTMASALSYTTLLALVPLAAIGFAILSAFPVFDDVQAQIREFVFRHFLPRTGDVVEEEFARFLANTGRLTALGILGLGVTALLLLITIEDALNTIFRVTRPRPLLPRLVAFWTVLTLGPLLLGASVSVSNTLTRLSGIDALAGFFGFLAGLLPVLLEILAFSLTFAVMPNRPVLWRHALAGATAAAVLFEWLKYGFSIYLTYFPAYETVYGALAAIPTFLLYMYASWLVILVGAVLAAALPEWRPAVRHAPGEGPLSPERRFALALAMLSRLARAAQRGGGARYADLRRDLPVGNEALERLLAKLQDSAYVDRSPRHGWVLVRDLSHTTLYDLYQALDLGFHELQLAELRNEATEPWLKGLNDAVCRLGEQQKRLMDRPLKPFLLAQAAAEPEEPPPPETGDVSHPAEEGALAPADSVTASRPRPGDRGRREDKAAE